MKPQDAFKAYDDRAFLSPRSISAMKLAEEGLLAGNSGWCSSHPAGTSKGWLDMAHTQLRKRLKADKNARRHDSPRLRSDVTVIDLELAPKTPWCQTEGEACGEGVASTDRAMCS